MTEYVLSEAAALDLETIWEFIAQDSIPAADRWIARLFDAFEGLARSPGIGHFRNDLTNAQVLFWPVKAYLIIYRLHSESVQIIAITQGSRDIPTFLSDRLTEPDQQ